MSGQSCQDALSTRTVLQPCPKACAVGRRGLPAAWSLFPGLLGRLVPWLPDGNMARFPACHPVRPLTIRWQDGGPVVHSTGGGPASERGQESVQTMRTGRVQGPVPGVIPYTGLSGTIAHCARDVKPQPAGTAFFSFCPGLRGRAGAAGMHIGDSGLWKKMFVRQHRNVWP